MLMALSLILPLRLASADNCPKDATDYQITEIHSILVRPWKIAFLPGDDLLISEIPGTIKRLSSSGALLNELSGIPRISNLLDIEIDLRFKYNRYVYLAYTRRIEGMVEERIDRFQLVGRTLSGQTNIFSTRPPSSGGPLLGGRMVFENDKTLVYSVGQHRAGTSSPQELSSHFGKIIRINTDGTVPSDNPFLKVLGAQPEIFSIGHRNAQGLAFWNGVLFAVEHGPIGGDELNVVVGGANYGWPLASHGVASNGRRYGRHSERNFQAPTLHWSPAIAPSSLTHYTGKAFPKWQESLFLGSLKQKRVLRLTLIGQNVWCQYVLFEEISSRIRDVAVDREGLLYVLTDGVSGKLYRITPK